jgi:S-adenosylmethionine synthetase
MADIISDVILDDILQKDKNSKVDCKVALTKGICFVTGEVNTTGYSNIQDLARDTIRDIGYTDASYGFDYRSVGIINVINEQSQEIYNYSNDNGLNADDMSIVYGYATDENSSYLPTPIYLANILSKRLSEARKDGSLSFLRPDGKILLGVKYIDNKPIYLEHICISAQHSVDINLERLRESIIDEVIDKTIDKKFITKDTKILINASGSFSVGGPQIDSGMTGKKISGDTYGGIVNSNGNGFSGKDPSKIDRSGSYMARYIAKNLVHSKIAKRVLVTLSFSAGIKNPISINVSTYGTSSLDDSVIAKKVEKYFKLDISSIIDKLDLLNIKYANTSSYGHFKENNHFTWEKLEDKEELSKYFS